MMSIYTNDLVVPMRSKSICTQIVLNMEYSLMRVTEVVRDSGLCNAFLKFHFQASMVP